MESFRLQATQSLLECRDLFAGDLGKLAEVKKEREFIMVARICVSHFMGDRVRAQQQIRLVEGNHPHVAVPNDLFVPVNVKLVRVGLVQDGLEKGGCILGGAVFQTFVGFCEESSTLLCWSLE